MPSVTTAADSPITVREVLALSALRRGVPELLSGEDGLDRAVRWVHSGDVPHIAAMLRGGEFLLMTGIGIGHGERSQRELVAELAERRVAALAIELGTRFSRLPRALVAEAAERGLPLVALHKEIRFVDVTEAVHRVIVGRQLELMRHGDELNRRFTALMLDGAGVPELLRELAAAIGNPVVFERRDRGVLYHATHGADDAAVLAAWDAFAAGLPGALDAVTQPVLAGGGERWGRLVALALDGAIDLRARVAIERAVGLVALALHRDRAEQVVASRERGNFLAGLLEGEVGEAEARSRAAEMGMASGAGSLLPVAAGPAASRRARPASRDEEAWSLVWRDLGRALDERRLTAIAGTREGERELLLVVALRDADARARTADMIAAILSGACERHLGTPAAAVACVGATAASWTAAGESLRVAADGLAAAAHGRQRKWHDATLPDLDGLLWSLRDRPELGRFTASRLEPLLDHDRRRRAKLLPTLEALCRNGGHKADTARELHIERQSLYHRLARIEKLLGVDPSDPEALLDLHLALRAHSQPPG